MDTLDEYELRIAEGYVLGQSLSEIGALVGVTKQAVSQVVRRPHVARWITESQAEAQAAVRQAMVNAAPVGVRTLVEIAQNPDAPAAARVTAARSLVEFGTPREPVRVVHAGAPEAPIQHTLAQLSDEALETIRRELGLTP